MAIRRRAKKDNFDPFGFSFLAVLSCVLGVVIFLLTYLTSYSNANSDFIDSMFSDLKAKITTLTDEKHNKSVENNELEEYRKMKDKDYKTVENKLNEVVLKSSELKNKIEKLENEGPTIRLVPYKGKAGTEKIPVYVECKEYAIVIYPEKVVINKTNISNDNTYIRKLTKNLKQNTDKRYALFLIHPTGFETYYEIRSIILEYDINIGYEPVDADWQLQL